MSHCGYLEIPSDKEAERLHYKFRRPELLRKALWLAFLIYCVLSTICFGAPNYQPACLVLALLYGFVLALPGYFSLANELRSYRQAHGSLDGFSLERAYATDIESSFTVDGEAKQVFSNISQALLHHASAKFRRHDESLGELEAAGRASSSDRLLSDPCNIFVGVSAPEEGKVNVRSRIVASALTQSPRCHAIENMIRSAATTAATTGKEEIGIQRYLPVWSARIIKSIAVFGIAALLGTLLHNCYAASYNNVVQMLDANEYGRAYEAIAKEESDGMASSYTSLPVDKFVALLGQKRYAEALDELDQRADREYIAFAQAQQGKMQEARKTLASIEPGLPDTDIGAFYLAKAMVAQAAGNQDEEVNDLAVARCTSNELHNLASQTEISLLNALGKHSDARAIEKAMSVTISDAKSSIAYEPWQFPLYAGGLFIGYSVASVRANKRWHKKPAGLPPLEKEIGLTDSIDPTAAFDHCLLALAKTDCTVTNMDDESGLVEAADADGNHLIIKLSQAASGCKMSVRSNSSKASAAIKRLQVALSEQ